MQNLTTRVFSQFPKKVFRDIQEVDGRFLVYGQPPFSTLEDKKRENLSDGRTFYDFTTGQVAYRVHRGVFSEIFCLENRLLALDFQDWQTVYDLKRGESFKLPQKVDGGFRLDNTMIFRGSDHKTFFDILGNIKFELPKEGSYHALEVNGALLTLLSDKQSFYDMRAKRVASCMSEYVQEEIALLNRRCLALSGDSKRYYDIETGRLKVRFPEAISGIVQRIGDKDIVQSSLTTHTNNYYDIETGRLDLTLPCSVYLELYHASNQTLALSLTCENVGCSYFTGRYLYDMRTGKKVFEIPKLPRECVGEYDFGCVCPEQSIIKGNPFLLSYNHRTFLNLMTRRWEFELPSDVRGAIFEFQGKNIIQSQDQKRFYEVRF